MLLSRADHIGVIFDANIRDLKFLTNRKLLYLIQVRYELSPSMPLNARNVNKNSMRPST